MTVAEAKETLLLYRPGTRDDLDPDVREALALVPADPELKQWFDQHCAFQRSMQSGLRRVNAPPELKNQLLLAGKVITPKKWWRSPVVLAAAAMVTLLLVLRPLLQPAPEANRFTDFAAKMSSTVQREYRMDVESQDMAAVRKYMASKGSPADFEVPGELETVQLAGGGFVRWRNKPVSMICFRKASREMSYLFVADRSVVVDPPPVEPVKGESRGLPTVAWTRGDKVYLLANPP